MQSHQPKLLSFSGIDGAGKSTQIDSLLRHLDGLGRRFQLFTFWDDVVTFSKYREYLSLRLFKGDKGVGSPERPIARRDKNVTSWYVVIFRLVLYALDAFRLSAIVSNCFREDVEFIVFDRYIYDELANLPLRHWLVPIYIRLLLRIAPKPDVAFLLDADPERAVARKPEYPLEFVRRNRDAYLGIAALAGVRVLPPSSIEEANELIIKLLPELKGDANSSVSLHSSAFPTGSPETHRA